VVDWLYFYPAAFRGRFWWSVGEVLVKGAFTGGLMFGAICLVGSSYDKIADPEIGRGFADKLAGLHGWKWIGFLATFWFAGVALYSARRIWSAAEDAQEALRAITLKLGDGPKLNGLAIFAKYGPLLNTRLRGTAWIDKVRADVAGGVANLPADYTYRMNRMLSDVLGVLRRQRLLESDSPSHIQPDSRDYWLGPDGEAALEKARKKIGGKF